MKGAVVFLLGAGFSAPFGVPTMHPFLKSFRSLAQRKYPDLCDTLGRHFDGLDAESDIEALLSSLGRAERLIDSLPPGESVPESFRVWQEESRYLRSHLISYIIEECERFNQSLATEVLAPGLQALCAEGNLNPIHIFTTNYDRVIEHACAEAEIEFADGFGSVGNELVAPWNRLFDGKVRLYKLHGSVSYYVNQGKGDGAFLRLDRGYPLPGPDFRLSKGGSELEPLMVLPTLEKDTLGEPYSHLNHLFTETMSDALLVVAIGTSLRDNHIVSAIRYNAKKVVVIVVDEAPLVAAGRISGISNVKLKADARLFWEKSLFELIPVLRRLAGSAGNSDDVHRAMEAFVEGERDRIAEFTGLTEEQQEALHRVLSSDNNGELIGALHRLRGVSEERVVQAIGNVLERSVCVDVRKAVVACLGYSNSPVAISVVGAIAREECRSDVRLEAYLVLEAIGGDKAQDELKAARERRPEDGYFRY